LGIHGVSFTAAATRGNEGEAGNEQEAGWARRRRRNAGGRSQRRSGSARVQNSDLGESPAMLVILEDLDT
jgi:hypothetical protein